MFLRERRLSLDVHIINVVLMHCFFLGDDGSLIIIYLHYFWLYFQSCFIVKSSLTLSVCRERDSMCLSFTNKVERAVWGQTEGGVVFLQWHLRGNLNQNDLRRAPSYPPWNVCQCGDRAIYPAIHCNWLLTRLEQTLIPRKKWAGREVCVCVCGCVCKTEAVTITNHPQ